MPREYRLEVLIPVGYAGEERNKEVRKGLEEVTSMNHFGAGLHELHELHHIQN